MNNSLLTLVHDSDRNQISLLDAALKYADRGWRVFPLTEGKKAPALIKSWNTRATDSKEQIKAWWKKWPKANIGILTGEKSGIFVVDIDPKNGGDESITDLLKDRELPNTSTVRTGSGGSHIFFRYPDEKIKTRRGFPGAGIDICSNGGYVVAAPSIHPNGTAYLWANNHKLNDAPQWLLDLLLSKENKPVDTQGFITVGTRNVELYKIGCSLRGKGLKSRELGTELHRINKYQCEVPLDDSEVNIIIDSVNQYIAGSKKPLFRYRDFIRSNEFPSDGHLRHICHVISFYMDENGNNAYPTMEQITQDTGYSLRLVKGRIKKAERKGLILVSKHQQRGQKYPNNIYHLPRRFMKPGATHVNIGTPDAP